ncbi:MAG TPA: DUF2752 domain-containing protein [Thermoanaerobaculia bacterium]|nr:DUF2752 domain-containing protein [Thermoanaerobaculia bacterium]HUM30594.1 DUF2752 domain-containing protein [Thermoanaerobaculia bacterium]HXK68878.1 DUF2752 domain-containing protein [Thermoanaerobaculia bacterium]
MKLSLSRDTIDPPYGFIFMAVVAAAGLFFLFIYPFLPLHVRHCVFHQMTGYPCPTCGSTRAALTLLHGHPIQALAYNPLAILSGMALGVWGMASFFFEILGKRRFKLEMSKKEGNLLRVSAILAILLNWAWLIYWGV